LILQTASERKSISRACDLCYRPKAEQSAKWTLVAANGQKLPHWKTSSCDFKYSYMTFHGITTMLKNNSTQKETCRCHFSRNSNAAM